MKSYYTTIGKPERKNQLGKHWCRWEEIVTVIVIWSSFRLSFVTFMLLREESVCTLATLSFIRQVATQEFLLPYPLSLLRFSLFRLVPKQVVIKDEVVKTKLHGLSPRANSTDRTTAACRRSDCQLFSDRGCHVVSVTDPCDRILCFLDRSRYFSIKLYSRA
jgi:hypothetical protein